MNISTSHMEYCPGQDKRAPGQYYSQFLHEKMQDMHACNPVCITCKYRPEDLEAGYMTCMTCRTFASCA